jgi:hypothetical protein
MNEFTSPCFERRPNGGMGVLLVLSKLDFVKVQLELTSNALFLKVKLELSCTFFKKNATKILRKVQLELTSSCTLLKSETV